MISIDVRTDFREVFRALDLLNADVQKAAMMALNKVAGSVRTEATRNIAKASGMKVSDVKAKMPVIRANRFNLTAQVKAEPWSPNLIRYGARETKKGVSAKAWGKRKVYKGAFIGNQGRTVFARVGKERLPIKALHGPSVPKEFMREANIAAMRSVITKRFPLEFDRAMQQRLRRKN